MTTAASSSAAVRVVYDDAVVRKFVWASVGWGLIGLLVGLLCALQLSLPALNFDIPWLTFSRLRPLHTNAVIFALVGNMMFAGVYYSTQRLLKARMGSDLLSGIHFWGWQTIILGAALTLPLGITQSKEYAELEWPLDILVALVWVAFAVNFFWTIAVRREKHLYVAIWFYIATILTVAMLYIVNNLALPISGTKSYSLFSGTQDALTQWWYGHNAVAFFLTTPILGIMYYFLPKAAERPVYSYRLSIVHFWALVFIYIWAGPHHLLYTALPDWAQSLGMVFSLMLWAPSWGGMLNGLLTLRGAWHKVRTDPVLKFFVAGVTFYGMATFEGPLLSIKSVSALGHYTNWIIAHVHNGALGWNGFMAAGLFYWLVPKLYGKELHSKKLADMHFWIGTIGILLYVVSMWVAGVTEGLMTRAEKPTGGLVYPEWIEINNAIRPLLWIRSLGGGLFILGWVVMAYNLVLTMRSGAPVTSGTDAAPLPRETGGLKMAWSMPVMICVVGMVCLLGLGSGNVGLATLGTVGLIATLFWGAFMLHGAAKGGHFRWHHLLEGRPLAFAVLVMVSVVAGGVVELLPGIIAHKEVPLAANGQPTVLPYSALELEGRDIYVREGCYVCHSQMIRPFRAEIARFDRNNQGGASRAEESIYDHPFQWGSRRTGPDLAREAGMRDNEWHWKHLINPDSISQGSNMPGFPWLAKDKVAFVATPAKMRAMKTLGVPYTQQEIDGCQASIDAQAAGIVETLKAKQITAPADCELVALIAYLQRLGKNATKAQ